MQNSPTAPAQPDPPHITAVVIAGNQRERAERSLASIVRQNGLDVLGEVILIDAGTNSPAPLPSSTHPKVRVVRPEQRASYGTLRAEAVHLAQGRIVAFLEEHAMAQPGWLTGIEAVFRETGCAAASGEVSAANPGYGISNAIAMMNYYRWLPPVQPHDAPIIVGHNAAYERNALLAMGDDLPQLLDSEPVLQQLLTRKGQRLRIDPRIRITHQNETDLGSIFLGYYLWNTCFGAHRAHYGNWHFTVRLLRIAATPLVPFVRLVRMSSSIALARRAPVSQILRFTPVMLAAHVGAALGLARGYLGLLRDAPLRLTDYELDRFRAPLHIDISDHA